MNKLIKRCICDILLYVNLCGCSLAKRCLYAQAVIPRHHHSLRELYLANLLKSLYVLLYFKRVINEKF